MKNLNILFLMLVLTAMSSCIKDDFVVDTIDASLRILTNVESIEINSEIQFEAMYLDNIGQQEEVQVEWSSSDTQIVSISSGGLAMAIDFGSVTIQAEYFDGETTVQDLIEVTVGQTTVIGSNSVTSQITTTSSYVLEGEFVFSESANGVNISIKDDYKASTALPGLYLFLSNNKNSIGDAFEVGEVKVFEGAHEYDISGVSFGEYKYLLYFCKPFNVKVGDGEL